MKSIAAFTAAFSIVDRETEETLLYVSKAQAQQIQRDIDEDGGSANLHNLGLLVADLLVDQEIQVDVQADDATTALAVFKRMSEPMILMRRLGVIEDEVLQECAHFYAPDLPPLNVREMDELMVAMAPLNALMSIAEEATKN